MARVNLDGWIPEERGSDVLAQVDATSAVEALATKETMSTDAKIVPSVNGVSVSVIAKGASYPEDTTPDGEVTLKARKFGTAVRIAEEDLADIPQDVIAAKQKSWARSYAIELDNAALATTAEENGSTVPFTSVYRKVSQDAADNLIQTAGAVSYDDFSTALATVEGSDFAENIVVIAHPFFKGAFRSIKDDNGSPIFVQGLAGTPDTVFGYRVVWSAGAKTSAVATHKPTGNPLLIVANSDHLLLGVRSGPESFLASGNDGASMLTDEALLKMRSRRGFAAGDASAFAIIEVTAGA